MARGRAALVVSAAHRTAFVIPDIQTWMLHGRDPLAGGVSAAVAPERAGVFLVPQRVPSPLVDAVSDAWGRTGPRREYVVLGDPLDGAPIEPILGADGENAPDAHDHNDGEGHDHHDMMAIEGDPSADGLIMEPLDFSLGPIAPSLAGGLVVDLSLDGDMVAHAHARATLPVGTTGDPLTPLTWRVVRQRALETPSEATARRQTFALEIERALSHALSLVALGSAMGWRDLRDAAYDLSRALLPARDLADRALRPEREAPTPGDGRAADAALARIGRLLRGRGGRRRLVGRGVVARAAAEESKLGGPVARATGLSTDARSDDPLYSALGFTPELGSSGDAAARVDLRLAEVAASLRLASAALADTGSREPVDVGPPGLPVEVEGPRGSLIAIAAPAGQVAVATPGAALTLELAGSSIVGLELGAAIVTLVSFDVSPWRVDA